MHAHVGHFFQPPGGHLVEVLQRAELATAEQVFLHKTELSLDLTLGLWPPTPTGHRPEAVVSGERQEAGVVDRLAVLVTGHHRFHVVVQAGGSHAVHVLEGVDVLADRGFQVGRRRESQILPAGVPQHVAEKIHLAAPLLGEIQRVNGPVHLSLESGTRFKAFHRRPRALLSQLLHADAENGITARIALTAKFFQKPNDADVRIPRQKVLQCFLIGIHHARPSSTGRRQCRLSRRPLLLVLGNDLGHGLPRDVQVAGDIAARLPAVPTPENLVLRFVAHGR